MTKMLIYILTWEAYDEYYIIGTFASKERAQQERSAYKRPKELYAVLRIYSCKLDTTEVTEV